MLAAQKISLPEYVRTLGSEELSRLEQSLIKVEEQYTERRKRAEALTRMSSMAQAPGSSAETVQTPAVRAIEVKNYAKNFLTSYLEYKEKLPVSEAKEHPSHKLLEQMFENIGLGAMILEFTKLAYKIDVDNLTPENMNDSVAEARKKAKAQITAALSKLSDRQKQGPNTSEMIDARDEVKAALSESINALNNLVIYFNAHLTGQQVEDIESARSYLEGTDQTIQQIHEKAEELLSDIDSNIISNDEMIRRTEEMQVQFNRIAQLDLNNSDLMTFSTMNRALLVTEIRSDTEEDTQRDTKNRQLLSELQEIINGMKTPTEELATEIEKAKNTFNSAPKTLDKLGKDWEIAQGVLESSLGIFFDKIAFQIVGYKLGEKRKESPTTERSYKEDLTRTLNGFKPKEKFNDTINPDVAIVTKFFLSGGSSALTPDIQAAIDRLIQDENPNIVALVDLVQKLASKVGAEKPAEKAGQPLTGNLTPIIPQSPVTTPSKEAPVAEVGPQMPDKLRAILQRLEEKTSALTNLLNAPERNYEAIFRELKSSQSELSEDITLSDAESSEELKRLHSEAIAKLHLKINESNTILDKYFDELKERLNDLRRAGTLQDIEINQENVFITPIINITNKLDGSLSFINKSGLTLRYSRNGKSELISPAIKLGSFKKLETGDSLTISATLPTGERYSYIVTADAKTKLVALPTEIAEALFHPFHGALFTEELIKRVIK